MEVYYVDDFGGKIPDSWLGQGGSPDDCWHRVEVVESLCKSCGQPCLGVGKDDSNWGLPSCLWTEENTGEVGTLEEGEPCTLYFNRDNPPWGKRHEWRADNGGRWFFVERLEDGGEIHCPTSNCGVFPAHYTWEAAVASHEVDSGEAEAIVTSLREEEGDPELRKHGIQHPAIEPLPRPRAHVLPCPCGAMTALDCAGECGAT